MWATCCRFCTVSPPQVLSAVLRPRPHSTYLSPCYLAEHLSIIAMSDRERNIDLTPSSPPAPLPAPTTVSNRSLRPRRQQARASAEAGARSSTVSSSRSRSRSESGSSQLLYPEDPDSPEYLADSPANPPGRVSPRPEEPLDAAESSRTNNGVVSNSIAGDASSDGVATTGTKRRRSPSPVASSSRSEKRKGKRRALDTTGTHRISHVSGLL